MLLLSDSYMLILEQVTWGLVCALFATVKSAAGLLAIRFFLGLAEAGFLPGIVYWRQYSFSLPWAAI